MKSNILPYVLIAALLFIIYLNNCTGVGRVLDNGNDKVVDTDTTYIEKIIPGKERIVYERDPFPVYIDTTDTSPLYRKIASLENDKERLKYALKELRTRVYDSTYAFDKGTVRIQDTVQGKLLGRQLTIKTDDIPYVEKTITKTVEKYPDFTITGGLTTGASLDETFVRDPYIGLELGFKNAKGYHLEFSYNTNKTVGVSLSKDLFVKYKDEDPEERGN